MHECQHLLLLYGWGVSLTHQECALANALLPSQHGRCSAFSSHIEMIRGHFLRLEAVCVVIAASREKTVESWKELWDDSPHTWKGSEEGPQRNYCNGNHRRGKASHRTTEPEVSSFPQASDLQKSYPHKNNIFTCSSSSPAYPHLYTSFPIQKETNKQRKKTKATISKSCLNRQETEVLLATVRWNGTGHFTQ